MNASLAIKSLFMEKVKTVDLPEEAEKLRVLAQKK